MRWWLKKQGLVRLTLLVLGMAAFIAAAFTITITAGLVVLGCMLWYLEWLTEENTQ